MTTAHSNEKHRVPSNGHSITPTRNEMAKVTFTSLNSGRVCTVEGDILPYDKRSDRIVIRTEDRQYEDVLVSTIIEIEHDSKDKK